MEKSRNGIVREGDERDLKGILSLRKIVFGEMEKDKLDPRFWRWEFMEGPDGKAFIYIIEDEERVVGHFADIPRQFSVNGEAVLGTISVDLMVHPDFRRKGFFFNMGRYAAQYVQSQNGLFMASFPIRSETINGFKKLGWKVASKLPVLVYPIQFQGIIRRYLRSSFVSFLIGGIMRFFHSLIFSGRVGKGFEGIHIDQVAQLDDQFDQFCQKAPLLHPIMGVRNQIFFKWRYLQHPTRTYLIYRAMKGEEMRGYIVLRRVDLLKFNSVVIVDLLALDEDALTALVKKGIVYSQSQGVDLLGCMLPKGHDYEKILKRKGFLPSLKTFLLMVYPYDKGEQLLSSKNWYVNWGDTDVI
jgi:GNAT superfamily N-acetyltransferase